MMIDHEEITVRFFIRVSSNYFVKIHDPSFKSYYNFIEN